MNEKCWYDIEPMDIMTPNGIKTITRLHFNGYEPTLHMIFKNDKGELYELDCTFNHPLRTVTGEWLQAEMIEPEHLFDNGYRLISSLVNEDVIPTFDFEVPEEHCYILESGIVSHNTALIMGGVSEGINPDPGMIYTQTTAAGEVERINPTFLNYMKKHGLYTKKHVQDVIDADGSVQNVPWLNDEAKKVFKTAFEINQEVQIRLTSNRQKHVCQAQSMNLFFSAEEDERWISHILRMALLDKYLKSVYYIYTLTGVNASKECESCQ